MKLHGTLVVLLLASISSLYADDPPPPPPAPPSTAAPAPTDPPTPKPTPDLTKCTHRKIPPNVETKTRPTLDDVFETTIEATFVKGNKFHDQTMEIKEYYDKKKNKAAVYVLSDGKETRHLFDVDNSYSFEVTKEVNKDFTCKVGPMLSEADSTQHTYFDFSKPHDGTGGTIQGLTDAFKFGDAFDNNYLGEVKVRGLDVDRWSTCVVWTALETSFYVDWYFSKPNYKMPSGPEVVPVRLEVTGFKGDKNGDQPTEEEITYHIMYDFVSYKKNISDYSVFWPELETLCGDATYYELRNKGVKMPEFKDTFSVNLEQMKDGILNNGKYVMDKTNNLMRMDIEITKEGDSSYKSKCNNVSGICKIIHDYSVGIEYLFDPNGHCRISNIQLNTEKEGKSGPGDAITDPNHRDKDNKTTYIMLATGAQLFQVATDDKLQYQGQRMFRGVVTNAYVLSSSTADSYSEFSFTTGDPPKLFGSIRNKGEAHIKTNFYNYNEAPDMAAFDIHDCFPDSMKGKDEEDKAFEILHGKLDLKETWDQVEAAGLVNVNPEIRKVLAQKAKVNTLRITDMLIRPEDGKPKGKGETTVWFTLLGPSPVSGSVWMPEGGILPTKDTEKAGEDLEGALENDVPVTFSRTINNEEKKFTFTLEGGSLKLNEDVMSGDPRPSAPATKSGYSTGNMALCGIISIVIGAFVGLGIGFYLWKRRNRGVPYQIHH